MYSHNLVIIHVPKEQAIADFLSIRNIMAGRAPDIKVHVVSVAKLPPREFWRTTETRPTLIFSPHDISLDASIKGARLISTRLPKTREAELLASAGADVPEMRLIMPETRLDEDQWGPFTVVKPDLGLRGRGIHLMHTRDVRWTDTSLLPPDDPRHRRELVAQRYIDTGPHFTCYRVTTVLGRPIFCVSSTALDRRPELDPAGAGPLDLPVAANNMARKLEMSNDPEIIELAVGIHAKLPKLPIMGLDIVREQDSGRLFVLEYNSSGRIWHLSSLHGLQCQREFGLDFYGQFHALETIADGLIEATRSLAQ
ncbi:MAG: hypothetical protein AB7F74_16305 [Parvibaculaceae bacterium]